MGQKSQSDRYSSRHHPQLVVEVVCRQQELPEDPHRLPGARVPEQEALDASVSSIVIERAAKNAPTSPSTRRGRAS